MNTLSKHFFMEVVVKLIHSTVDKYATIIEQGTVIQYTLKGAPKAKRYIDLNKGRRIFEDLYGDINQRWVVSPEFAILQVRKDKAAQRRNKNTSTTFRKAYGIKHANKGSA